MAPVRFAVSLQNDRPLEESIAHARLAEELGFVEVWTNENGHHRGIFTQAAALAGATVGMGVGLGVVNPFHRHPSVIAMEAATLDEYSGGRVRLGLGAALWNLRNLGELDGRADRPLTAMVEALRIIRALLRGDAVGETVVFPTRPDAHLDVTPVRPDLPVYAGAVNERMLRAAGAEADAVELGALMSTGYVRWALDVIAAGAASAGRDPATFDIAAPLMVSVGRDPRAARAAVTSRLAYYLHRVEPVVRDKADVDPAAVARVVDAVRDHGVEAGAAAVTDEVIDTFVVAGTPDHAAARFQAYADAGVRGLIVQHVPGPDRVEGLQLIAKEVIPHVH